MANSKVDPAPAATSQAWHSMAPDAVASSIGVDPQQGLSDEAVKAALAAHGPNALPEEKAEPGWRRFLDEYRSFMQIILLGAAVVSALIADWHTVLLLVLLTVLNAVIGLREEGKARSAMNALKSMMKADARVRRGGKEVTIPVDQVAVGDIVLLTAGDQVPADGRILAASALQIDESALTGESTPTAKSAAALSGDKLGPGDQTNMAFMNTPVTHGSGELIVTATGGDTEFGKISGMLKATGSEQTPLQRQLDRMTKWIALAAFLTMVVMFVLGFVRGESTKLVFVTAIALAIAAIPEALPTVVQVILSLGAVGLAKKNAIVKDLNSVETLGSTSAINSDKTGTLTMNQVTVVEVLDPLDRYTVTGTGYDIVGKVQHVEGKAKSIDDIIVPLVVANDAHLADGKVVGDPTEGAFLVLAAKAGLDADGTRAKYPRLATLPFDPTYKLMAIFTKAQDGDGKPVIRAFVKGAAPAVFSRTSTAILEGQTIAADDALKSKVREQVERMGGEGLRVMAAAIKDLDPATFDPNGDLLGYLTDMQATCMVGMIDPPRAESKDAVAAAQAAHIRVRMVTGDDVTTGAAIAKKLGIPGEAILGSDFAALPEDERLRRIDDIGVVGRVAPEHKVLMVETLRKKGEVVAMTGDGVNDAPAIKAADIGIAMGTGTEVAKSAGRMILSDDNFATIVFAVEQGRMLYDNLMKYVRFILITLVAFVLTFLGASLLNVAAGQPFTPTQILWMNFLIDAPLGVALGFDVATPGLMKRHPRSRSEAIIGKSVLGMTLATGAFMAVFMLWMLAYGINGLKNPAVGVTMALTAFAFFRIVCTYESRSMTDSVFRLSTFDCKEINRIALGEIVLAFLVTTFIGLQDMLGTTSLSFTQWMYAVVPAVALLLVWEVGKWIARSVHKK